MNPLFSIIKRVETPVDENGVQREYALYKKENFFAVECIDWKLPDETRKDSSQAFYKEFAREADALAAYDTLWGEREGNK